MKAIVACLSLILLAAPAILNAQGVGSSGEITGTIKDASGAVLPRVTVTVTDSATGFQRLTTTGSAGQFEVAGLPPATYDVTAKIEGFTTEVRKGVVVSLGRTVISDFT